MKLKQVWRVHGFSQNYSWGDPVALHELCDTVPDGKPLAEIWFGTHSDGPATLDDGRSLMQILDEPAPGADRPVEGLAYLAKFIAVARPLSLQVHPSRAQAAAGWERENAQGVPLHSRERSFKDRNHKPEMLYTLTPWRALVGFSDPSEVARFFLAVGGELGRRYAAALTRGGIDAFVHDALTNPPQEALFQEFREGCERILATGSEPQVDRARVALEVDEYFPTEPGVLIAAAMNHVRAESGQAVMVPVNTVHAYLKGVGLELMASSDNVIRAGLTDKHVDVQELLACANLAPTRPAFIVPTPVRGTVPMPTPSLRTVPTPTFVPGPMPLPRPETALAGAASGAAPAQSGVESAAAEPVVWRYDPGVPDFQLDLCNTTGGKDLCNTTGGQDLCNTTGGRVDYCVERDALVIVLRGDAHIGGEQYSRGSAAYACAGARVVATGDATIAIVTESFGNAPRS
ncbi:mannose-6-phosphate isomerase, class I [Gleimia hominis]|uniref:mannose-6-phosphate isomerase, class I n=1 Tax=Gleimia hominis TaxID=595468 RepID=UPI000C8080BE|nr:mannose-6-phosphate isomerase, class I [Gleimia hominis]WIK65360.1 mannose-6-phosphate isomerase, class I [Gleimia hominis]